MQSQLNIKRVDLGSIFKVAFLIYAGLGLLGGLIYAFAMMVLGGIGSAFLDEELPFGLIGGVLAVFLVPVIAFIYGAFGSVLVTAIGALFNLVTRVTGGVKFDVEVAEPTRPAVSPSTPVPPE